MNRNRTPVIIHNLNLVWTQPLCYPCKQYASPPFEMHLIIPPHTLSQMPNARCQMPDAR